MSDLVAKFKYDVGDYVMFREAELRSRLGRKRAEGLSRYDIAANGMANPNPLMVIERRAQECYAKCVQLHYVVRGDGRPFEVTEPELMPFDPSTWEAPKRADDTKKE